ncbi:MAG: NUDIX domain-containing protein [Planctomycetota bacterium]
MPLTPRYCSQCAQPVTTREMQGRPRPVCPACGTVFYANPLPVAAAIVLNARREVLLVKRRRPPHQGHWCLPMGFAELGETIAEAALRELQEETGLQGRVLGLVDSDSLPSEHYGDLLIVTFEVEKIGGREQPGDDADDVRYWPLGQHPPLAFSSNDKALRQCIAARLETWAMQDSFDALQRGDDRVMLSDDLIALVQDRAAEVARQWLADVRSNPTTPTYHTHAEAPLRERATQAVSQFGRWLRGDEAREEVRAFYRALGQERQRQGFRLHEVLSSLTLLKKHTWMTAWAHRSSTRPIDLYRLLELNRRTAVFFDKAIYHTARGFEPD